MPKILRAQTAQDEKEERLIRKLAGSRRAPADWSRRADGDPELGRVAGEYDRRPKFLKLMTDPRIGVIVAEYRDRGTRFGFTSIEQL